VSPRFEEEWLSAFRPATARGRPDWTVAPYSDSGGPARWFRGGRRALLCRFPGWGVAAASSAEAFSVGVEVMLSLGARWSPWVQSWFRWAARWSLWGSAGLSG
jgi:hypothetical protein